MHERNNKFFIFCDSLKSDFVSRLEFVFVQIKEIQQSCFVVLVATKLFVLFLTSDDVLHYPGPQPRVYVKKLAGFSIRRTQDRQTNLHSESNVNEKFK